MLFKSVNWSKEEIISEINNFVELYNHRPIKDNTGGMKFNHLFAFYFILKKINPSYVIESGVFKGQGTWLIEKTLPKAKILSLDINLKSREYISKNAKYSEIDFKFQNYKDVEKDKCLVLFDDHQNSYERLKECKWLGFKNIIFEDNYPVGAGDFYSLNHIIRGSGFRIKRYVIFEKLKGLIIFLNFHFLSLFKNIYPFVDIHRFRLNYVKPNDNDYYNLKNNIDTYHEFPSIFKTDSSDNEKEKRSYSYLLEDDKKDIYPLAYKERNYYNFFTYVKLR